MFTRTTGYIPLGQHLFAWSQREFARYDGAKDIELDSTVVASSLSPLVSSFDHIALDGLITFRADEKTQRRIEELAEKASDGALKPQEQREYESIIRTSSIVVVLQAQAEKLLADNQDSLQ